MSSVTQEVYFVVFVARSMPHNFAEQSQNQKPQGEFEKKWKMFWFVWEEGMSAESADQGWVNE